jgi:hypothetical protein
MVKRKENNISPSPILVIVFNRPSKTRDIVDFLKQLPCRKVYVAADGARHSGEADRCLEVRQIIMELKNHHHLETRFSDINLGCGKNVAGAIQWILEENETAIIVEDDVQITTHFIEFCDIALSRYQDEYDVAAISGGPLQNLDAARFPPLFLSSYPNIWGWATWRRAFQGFDLDLQKFSNRQIFEIIRHRFGTNIVTIYWWVIVLLVRSRRIDTWDFQFYFQTWAKQSFVLTPRANLTQNIGFDAEATHVRTAPTNVGQLNDESDNASIIPELDKAPPNRVPEYERQLDTTLYRINLFTLAKLIIKYAITKPGSYR